MTVKELIEQLQKYPEDATIRYFMIDEYGENYPTINHVDEFVIGEFSDSYEDYEYLKGSIIIR